MIGAIRSAKHRIQIKKVSYDPSLFKLLVSPIRHPTERDESDDIEDEKLNKRFDKQNKKSD